MDASITRRGQPCWYRVEGVGLMAVNDALILEGAIFQMIRKHFRKEPYYAELLDLMHEVRYRCPPILERSPYPCPGFVSNRNGATRRPHHRSGAQCGFVQVLSFQVCSSPSRPHYHFENLHVFPTIHRHSTIVIYKTALYSFYLPVALALLLCGFPVEKRNASDPDYYKIALDILVPLGEYFQIQDDYLDFSGTPEQIGKIGTDIVDNKCSWCINTALARASPTQRAILDANYGRKDSEAEERVKEVFREVGVDGLYAEYEAQSYARINALIDAVPEVRSPCGEAVLRRAVFRTFLEKIYKRTK